MRSFLSFAITAALSALAADATTVSILEMGKGGVVHKTSSTSETSAGGVMSFWKSTHDADSNGNTRPHRTAQYPNMSVVPDIFSRADGGVVIGVTGEVDLESMPYLASLVDEDKSAAVGHFAVPGKSGRKLMKHLNAPHVQADAFVNTAESKVQATMSAKGNTLNSVSVNVGSKDDAAAVDASLRKLLKDLEAQASKAGSTIVVSVVVDKADEKVEMHHRRRLEDAQGNNNNNNANNNNNGDYTYEIPGYYDDNGNFVTPWRTIFQIQYYNIVQWTAVGLFTILFAANFMTVNMPLMPDTLLFGESAKMVAE